MDGGLERVHATAIAADGRAALIFGASGAGKSDLALRCLSLPLSSLISAPVRLVSDDQVLLERRRDGLWAAAPATLRGKLEVRGLGIVEVEAAPASEVELAVELAALAEVPRLPDPWPQRRILGLRVPVLKVWAFEASAAQKVVLALLSRSLPAVQP